MVSFNGPLSKCFEQSPKNINLGVFKETPLKNFKQKYLFNLGKQVTKINKTFILSAIWTMIHHNNEEK